MSQDPTNASPIESIIQYGGLQDQQDSLKRPKGTITSGSNIYDEQVHDANRRAGRDFDRLESDAISALFQFTWDDSGVTLAYNSGSTGKNDALVYPSGGLISDDNVNPNSPGPMPNIPFYLPFIKNSFVMPDFGSIVRALSEARQYVNNGIDNLSFPNQIWGVDFYEIVDDGGNAIPNLIQQNVRTKDRLLDLISKGYKGKPNSSYPQVAVPNPATGIPDDFYYVDFFVDRHLILQYLQTLVTRYNFTINNSYLKTSPIVGAASLLNYGGADFYNPPGYQFSNRDPAKYWKNIWNTLATRINTTTTRVNVSASQTSLSAKVTAITWDAGCPGFCANAKTKLIAAHPSTAYDTSVIYNEIPCGVYVPDPPTPFSSSISIQFYSSQSASQLAFITAKGTISADLSAYPSDRTSGASLYIKLGLPTYAFTTETFGQINPSGGSLNVYSLLTNETPIVGTNWESSTILNSDNDSNIQTTGVCVNSQLLAWYIALQNVVLTRKFTYSALGPYAPASPALTTPYEAFGVQDQQQFTTSETAIQWGNVKLTSSGGADPSIYPAPASNGAPVDYTPSSIIQFSSNAPGFNRNRFKGDYYRPTIACQLRIQPYAASGSPTTVTVKMYVNGTLVQTNSVAIGSGTLIGYAFSIEGVGDFTSFRPPDNDVSDGLDGWPNPYIQIKCYSDTGSVYLVPTFLDFVTNYPV